MRRGATWPCRSAMAADPPAVGFGQPARQRDGVAFHHQVEVHPRLPQQQVADEATDDVDGRALRLRPAAPPAAAAPGAPGPAPPPSAAPGWPGVPAGLGRQGAQQVGAGDDADDLARSAGRPPAPAPNRARSSPAAGAAPSRRARRSRSPASITLDTGRPPIAWAIARSTARRVSKPTTRPFSTTG